MAVTMRVTVRADELRRMLDKLEGKVDDFTVPLKKSGVYMEGAIGKRFNSAPWPGLSSATIKRHPHRAGGRPLNDTGRLRASVTSGARKLQTQKQLKYGTNLVYAPLHNFGGSTRFGYVPQREFLYFDAKDENMVRRIFEDYVRELVQ